MYSDNLPGDTSHICKSAQEPLPNQDESTSALIPRGPRVNHNRLDNEEENLGGCEENTRESYPSKNFKQDKKVKE